MRRDRCGGCGGNRLREFLDLGESPLADILADSPDDPLDAYPLQLAVCEACWLVQLMEVVPAELLYNGEYTYYAGVSKRTYHEARSAELLPRLDLTSRPFVVEVASNDGDLLRHFRTAGCRTLGVDPAIGPATAAAAHGVKTLTVPFGADTAAAIRDAHGPADLLIANHVAAHITDLDDFFTGIEILLAPDGTASVEVQYVADLLTGNQFDNVYHQHRYYYSLSSLRAVAATHRLGARDVQRVDMQGGSLHVTLHRGQEGRSVAELVRREAWLRSPDAYDTTQGRVDHIVTGLRALITDRLAQGRLVAGYGASAKSTTLLAYTGLGPSLAYVVDTTPAKVGKYLPGTGAQIVSVGQEAEMARTADDYLLTVWNYLPKVISREREFMDAGGHFVVPLPTPVLL